MKIIGALFIIGTSFFIGFDQARRLTERTRQIRHVKNALLHLEAEIMFGHAPLHEASRRIAGRFSGPIGELFQVFAASLIRKEILAQEAWELSIEQIWKKTAFKQTERDILLQFGKTLGKHDLEHQQKQIRLALSHLERVEKEAEENQRVYGNMYRSLGLLTGLLITLLLI